jgi:hypothetical protein
VQTDLRVCLEGCRSLWRTWLKSTRHDSLIAQRLTLPLPLAHTHTRNHTGVKFSFVFDPFLGTGGILLACGYFGAVTMGADLDWR